MMELRYNPLTGQWIMVSAVRKKRPWRPRDFCPFCPGSGET
ncbi:MAG TPA: galactose-1-phosphate uridylyltransferase, partial [Thermococcus paralvinellae]|nr:galactose-1-phosphate uridylyltransferase [Thermococcus paralvinellae]